MSRNEQDRLRDIKDAIVAIHGHLARTGDEPAGEDAALLHDALLFQFVVLGEAAKNLAPETRLGTRDPLGGCRRPARPDRTRYDLAGAAICLVGVAVIMYAPR